MGALVVLTDQVFPDTEVEERRLAEIGASLTVLDDATPEAIRQGAAGADALLTTYATIDSETVAALTRCRVIARYGIGVDNIDLDAARARGIVVTNVPDYCVGEVADHTVALLLAAARKVVEGNHLVQEGRWGIGDLIPMHRLDGLTLGLVGYGRIAVEVARRAQAFGLRVSAYDPFVPADRMAREGVGSTSTLEELLAGSAFVSVHVPLTSSTRGLIDATALERMPSGAVLVNTSRGPIVDTDAVLAALRSGRLSAACLDVFEAEPPDPTLLAGALNLIVTPHAAFYSQEAIQESQTKASQAVVDVLSGREPAYRVV